jgi:hypothetical protein
MIRAPHRGNFRATIQCPMRNIAPLSRVYTEVNSNCYASSSFHLAKPATRGVVMSKPQDDPLFPPYFCRDCGSEVGFRSRRRNFAEKFILPLLFLRPVRCGGQNGTLPNSGKRRYTLRSIRSSGASAVGTRRASSAVARTEPGPAQSSQNRLGKLLFRRMRRFSPNRPRVIDSP